LVGNDDMATEQEMRQMWTESMNNVGSTQEHITYEHFLLIMKGQTEKAVKHHHIDRDLRPTQLESVPEQEDELHASDTASATETSEVTNATANPASPLSPTKTSASKTVKIVDAPGLELSPSRDKARFLLSEASNQTSLPNLRAAAMYDSEGSLPAMESPSMRASMPASSQNATWSTPPDTGANNADAERLKLVKNAISFPPKPSVVTRRRSKSFGNEEAAAARPDSPTEDFLEDVEATANLSKSELGVDARRAVVLPEKHDAIQDELANKSALYVNRELYRAHRRMRISVLDASRRFEEKQAIRARDKLMKEQVKEAMGAGLVMRHGTKLQVTSEAIRKYLDEAMAKQQVLLEKANRRGGRGRRTRKKTISDMSAMMSPSMTQDEMGEAALQAWSQTPDSKRTTATYDFAGAEALPDLSMTNDKRLPLAPRTTSGGTRRRHSGNRIQVQVDSLAAIDDAAAPSTPNLPQIDHKSLRKPTVPGQFMKTEDPFGASGMYGAE